MSDILLGVNIDHVATLRNVRGVNYPDPVQAAFVVEQAGADSITIHLREDRRHIKDRDIFLLKKTIHTSMNLELAIEEEIIATACELQPNFCCLVPENRQEITTESGLDVLFHQDRLKNVIIRLQSVGIDVSLFLNADKDQISAAFDLGVSCVELNTGPYVTAINNSVRISEFRYLKECVNYALNLGLRVNAGHGLDYHNVKWVAELPLHMLHIGHSIISRSLFYGLFAAVSDMKKTIKGV